MRKEEEGNCYIWQDAICAPVSLSEMSIPVSSGVYQLDQVF